MKRIYPLFLLLLAAGCASGDARLREALQGDWQMTTDSCQCRMWELPDNYRNGFGNANHLSFSGDSLYWLSGALAIAYDARAASGKTLIFNGNRSLFQVKENQLWANDLYEGEWKTVATVARITPDSLYLICNQTCRVPYVRIKPPVNPPAFDAVFYYSGRISSILYKNGKTMLQIWNSDFSEAEGLFEAQLEPWQSRMIWHLLAGLPVQDLQQHYVPEHSGSHSPMTFLTFTQNGKIVKQVSDYNDAAPDALTNLYLPLSALPSSRPLVPVVHPDGWASLLLGGRQYPTDTLDWYYSENFFLLTELLHARPVDTPYMPLFTLRFWQLPGARPEVRSILSDGRFYTLVYADQSRKTFDLGYDFVKTQRHGTMTDSIWGR